MFIFLIFGVKRAMFERFSYLRIVLCELFRPVFKKRFYKAVDDVSHRLLRRMNHILGIETIVAQFVVHNLVCRKIRAVGIPAHYGIGGKQQSRLA